MEIIRLGLAQWSASGGKTAMNSIQDQDAFESKNFAESPKISAISRGFTVRIYFSACRKAHRWETLT